MLNLICCALLVGFQQLSSSRGTEEEFLEVFEITADVGSVRAQDKLYNTIKQESFGIFLR